MHLKKNIFLHTLNINKPTVFLNARWVFVTLTIEFFCIMIKAVFCLTILYIVFISVGNVEKSMVFVGKFWIFSLTFELCAELAEV